MQLNPKEFSSLCFLVNSDEKNTEIVCTNDSLIKRFLNNDYKNVDYFLFKKINL